MNKGVFMCYMGVMADIITTFIGLSLGFTESNKFGLTMVVLVSGLIICMVYFLDKMFISKLEKGYKLNIVTTILFLSGIFRLYIAVLNVKTILTGF